MSVRTIVLLQYSHTAVTAVPRNGTGAPHSGQKLCWGAASTVVGR
jgi:hypothetical protein